MTLKYVLVDNKLYHGTTEDLFLKCLSSDQARIAISKVHEYICGTHQLAPEIKWLFKRAGLCWFTMMFDYFKQYKGV